VGGAIEEEMEEALVSFGFGNLDASHNVEMFFVI
jgi:hypothetical protein